MFFFGVDHYNLDPNPAVSENGVNLNWPSNDRRNDHSLWESISFFFLCCIFRETITTITHHHHPPFEVHQLAERPHIHLFAGQPHEVSLSEMPKVARIIGFTAGLSNKNRDLAWFNPEKWWYNMKLYEQNGIWWRLLGQMLRPHLWWKLDDSLSSHIVPKMPHLSGW